MDDNNLISHLIDATQAQAADKLTWGNLVKGKKIKCTGTHTVDVNVTDDDQPVVLPQVDSKGIVVALEFRCTCGASATVALDYERRE